MSKTHIHGWYYIPPLFIFIAVSAVAISRFTTSIIKHVKMNELFIQLGLLFTVLTFSMIMLSMKIVQLQDELRYENEIRKKIGSFLCHSTPSNASIYLEPIGVIGYYSQRYVYDDAGLVSPQLINLNRLEQNARNRYKKIELVKPDYLILRNRFLDDFYNTTPLESDYRTLKKFDYFTNAQNNGLTIFSSIDNIDHSEK